VKVLHLINTLRAGGAEVNVVRLAQYADRTRVRPHLAYCGTWPLEAAVIEAEVPTFHLDSVPRRVKSLATPFIIARLTSYLRKHKIDLVHTHLFNAHAWGAVAARLAGVKVLEHVHDHRYTDRAILIKRGLAETRQYDRARYFARLSDRIVVLTNQNRNYVLDRVGIAAAKVSVIPNGLAPRAMLPNREDRAALRHQLGVPGDAIVLLAAGRLADEKNFTVLITALEALSSEIPRLYTLILGEGPELAALQTQIDRAGLGNICRLLGHKTDIQSYYDIADIFVQPSIFELQSLAMLEAMQARLPVVVSEGVGCNDDLIRHGESGFLVHPNQPKLWMQTIWALAHDPGLRTRVGENGKAIVDSQCDIRQVSQRFEALYEEICST